MRRTGSGCAHDPARAGPTFGLVARSGALAVASGVLLLGCVPDRPVRTEVDALAASVPCSAEVGRVLRAWSAGPRYLAGPPGLGGAARHRIPAGGIGRWVVLSLAPSGMPVLERWSDGRYERIALDRRCAPAGSGVGSRGHAIGAPSGGSGRAPSAPGTFTDDDLRRALAARGAGGQGRSALVVYAWSPHMPLSVDGYAEIRTAAGSLGMRVEPVLLPGSDRAFARREAERVGMPVAALREAASVELAMRDALVHAPTIVAFGRSRASPVLPGYRDVDGYREYLEAFLRGRGP